MNQLGALYIAKEILDEHVSAGGINDYVEASQKISEIINRYKRNKQSHNKQINSDRAEKPPKLTKGVRVRAASDC
jgi:hypothetical protein